MLSRDYPKALKLATDNVNVETDSSTDTRLDLLETEVGFDTKKGEDDTLAERVTTLETTVSADDTGLEDLVKDLQAAVGEYAGENDIVTDLGTVYKSVETADTGLNDRVTALETSVDTETTGLLDRMDALETAAGTYGGENDISTDLATVFSDVETSTTGLKDRVTALEGSAMNWTDTPPVNAVAASKVLTVDDVPNEGDTVTIGTVTYKARLDALGAGVAASGTLTTDTTNAVDQSTVEVDDQTYVLASTPDAANEVQIGVDADTTLANLVKAINGTGTEGVEYFAGTAPCSNVTAGNVAAHATTITADSVGFAGNLIALVCSESPDSHIDPSAATLAGGIDAEAANDVFVNSTAEAFIVNLEKAVEASGVAGTDYGTGTVANTSAAVSAKDASTATVTALTKGAAGNSIAIAESGDHFTWAGGATALSGGIDGTVATKETKYHDATYIYLLAADNTVADNNWRRIEKGSAY